MDITFNGLGLNMGNLARASRALSRSISAENLTGEKGKGGMATEGTGAISARELGQGWKVNPCLTLKPSSTTTLADIAGPGAVTHIWITLHTRFWRQLVLRIYWDNEATPSVETPVGDFFANGWCDRCRVNSLPISVNPAGGFNSYWEMPFRKHCRITIENLAPDEVPGFFYQIDYALTDVPEDMCYFHAQWRRSNPLPYMQVHTLLDGVKGFGHYVGTYMAWGVNNNRWWGEGELKAYIDGDTDFPTYCGTGTEDYFGGAWCFLEPKNPVGSVYEHSRPGVNRQQDMEYGAYSTPFMGMPQVIKPDGVYSAQQRFGLYRWHIMDPIRFQSDLRVTIQALGWRGDLEGKRRFLPLQDDIASTAFWYQLEPHASFPQLPGINYLEVI